MFEKTVDGLLQNSPTATRLLGALGGQPPVDPTSIRAKLMLQAAAFMMTEPDWQFRETRIELKSQAGEPGVFRLFGANHPDSLVEVFERRLDISIMNPSAILSMAHRGAGLFAHPMEVATIAVLPHYDQLGFAVSKASGIRSLDDIRERRYPLRLSTRGSLDYSTTRLVELVLKAHGFGYPDIISWGGSVAYDQPMPNDASRIGKAKTGELDAIFDEGVMLWANEVEAAGMHFLSLAENRLVALEQLGFRRGTIEKERYPNLPADVPTVDFSGWPIYCRVDTPDLLVRKFCESLEAGKKNTVWHIGGREQADLPLARMVVESAETPMDVPLHPAAQKYWTELGYLS